MAELTNNDWPLDVLTTNFYHQFTTISTAGSTAGLVLSEKRAVPHMDLTAEAFYVDITNLVNT